MSVNLGVLGATLAWPPVLLFFASGADSSLAWVQEFAIALGVLLPWFLVLAVVIVWSWKQTKRLRIAGVSAAIEPLGPGLLFLVTITWAAVMLVLASYVLIDPFTAILLVLFPTLGLGVCWLALTARAVYRIWRTPTRTRIGKAVAYLAPLPLAAAVLVLLISDDLPLRARFEISEGALFNRFQRFQAEADDSSYETELVGLYTVEAVYRRDGCVILETHSFIDQEAGFAYCTGALPTSPTVHMKHLKDRWWIYENLH